VSNLIATGKDLGELKKSALAVSKEVSEGPKGFLTYYNKAVESKDPKEIEANVTKLERFMLSQQDKLNAFRSEEARVLAEYKSAAAMENISLNELYDRVKNKHTEVYYTYGKNNKEAKLKKEAVLEKYLSGNGEFNGATYMYINMLVKEVEAMNRLHSSLVNDVAPIVMQEPVEVTEPEVTAPVENTEVIADMINKDVTDMMANFKPVINTPKENESETAPAQAKPMGNLAKYRELSNRQKTYFRKKGTRTNRRIRKRTSLAIERKSTVYYSRKGK
jgi:hypothetical protein